MRPILFEIGPVPLRSYGVMMMIGFLAGLYWAVRAAKKRGLGPAQMVDVCLYALISGIVGARLVYILLDWSEFRGHMGDVVSVWQGGLSFHGGLIFAIGTVYLYTRAKRMPFLQLADLLAPSLAMAYAFTRIGCFLNGCCYGIHTDLPWAVQFPDVGRPVHPAQLYASVASFLIFLALTQVQKWDKPAGYTFTVYVALYSVYRFLIEILRKGATASVLVDGLTEAQVVSVVMFVVAGVAFCRYGRQDGKQARNSI